jgi:hypothetical protein
MMHVLKIGNKAFLLWLGIMLPLVVALTVIGLRYAEFCNPCTDAGTQVGGRMDER